jgi:hypothetical protein
MEMELLKQSRPKRRLTISFRQIWIILSIVTSIRLILSQQYQYDEVKDVWNCYLSEGSEQVGTLNTNQVSEMMSNDTLPERPINQTLRIQLSDGLWNATPSESPIDQTSSMWNATPAESPNSSIQVSDGLWNSTLPETPINQNSSLQVSDGLWSDTPSESPINQTSSMSVGLWNATPAEDPIKQNSSIQVSDVPWNTTPSESPAQNSSIQVSNGLWNETLPEGSINQTSSIQSSSTQATSSLLKGQHVEESGLSPNSAKNAISSPVSLMQEQNGSVPQQFFKPRILVGIISDSQTEAASVLRNNHRILFDLWSDSRLCSLQEFRNKNYNETSYYTAFGDENISYDCQIVYSFILAAYSKNIPSPYFADDVQDIPTLRLYDTPDQPVVLDAVPLSNKTALDDNNFSPPYGDVLKHGDGTFLNIVENMDHGKTPTFLFWASKMSRDLNIPYIAKCDSDAVLNLNGLLQFLHQELPKIPVPDENQEATFKQPSVIAGSPILRKQLHNGWFLTTTNESFWEEEYYMGAHFYYNGGFYVMSRDLAESSTHAARKLEDVIPRIFSFSDRLRYNIKSKAEDKPHAYLEGAEDHDAISTAEHGHYDHDFNKNSSVPSIIQWLFIPRYARFHDHPAKNYGQWKPIFNREQGIKRWNKNNKGSQGSDESSVRAVDTQASLLKNPRSLIVVYGATLDSVRANYRTRLHAQGINACNGLLSQAYQKEKACDIHYFFVVGRDDTVDYIPGENIHNISELRWINSNSSTPSTKYEDDVLHLNVNGTNMEGLGLSTLYFIQEQPQSGPDYDSFDLIIFCKASHIVNVQQWQDSIVSTAQYSVGKNQHKHLLIGDVRDKGRKRREFEKDRCPDPLGLFKPDKSLAPHWIQLYLGSECFAFSSSLIPLWLEKARDPEIERCTEGQMGHDLTYLSYTTNATLHWMRVPNSLKFWSEIE